MVILTVKNTVMYKKKNKNKKCTVMRGGIVFEGKIEKKMKEIKTKKKKIEKRVKKHKQAKAELTKRTEKLEEHKKLVEEARTKYNEKTANIETSLEKLEKASPEEKVEALKKLGESIISKKANKLTRVLENKSLKPEQIAKITKKLTEMAEKKKGKNKTKLEKYNQKSGLKTEKLSEKIKLSNAEKEIQDKKLEEAKQNSANNKIDLNKKLEKYSEKANTKTGQTGEYNKAMVDVVKALQENPNLNNAALLARGKDLKGSAKAKFEKKIKLVKARVKHLKVIEEAHKLTEPSKKPGKELVEGKELLEESASNSTETIEHETKEKAERKAREKREDIKKLNEPLEKQNIYDKKTIDDYTTDIEKSKEIIKNTELKNEDIIKEYGKLETEIKELNTKRMSMSLNTPEIRLEHDLLLGEINAKKHKLENMDFSLQHNIENINSEDKRIGEKSAIIKELTKQIEKNEKTIYENEATISENTKPVAEEASAVETVETEKPANVVEVKAEESTAESTVKSKANVEIKAKLPKDPKDIKDEDVVKYLENSEKIFENKERNQIETDVKNFTLEKLKEYDETLSSNQKELEKLESKESKTEDDIKKIEELKEEIEELKEEKKTHLKIVKENMIYLEKINEIKKLPEKDRQKEMKLLLEEGVGTSFKHEYQTNKLRLSHEIEDLEIKSKKIIESKTAIIVEFEELKAESKQIIEQIDKEKNTEIKAILFNKLLKLTNNMDVKLQLVVEYKNKYEENSVQLDLKEEAQQNLESNHIDTITAIKLMENTYGQQIDSNSKLEDASDDFQEYKKNLKQKADVAGKKALDVVGEALSGEGVAGAAVNVALGSTGLGATVKTGERVLNAVGKEASVVVGKGITNTNPIKSSTKQNVENVENVKNVKNVENKKFNEDTKNGYNFVEGSRNVFEKDGKFYGKYTEGKTTHYFEVTKSKNGLNQDEYNLTPNGNKLRVEMVNRLIATESPATKNYEVRAIGSPTASTRTTEPEPEPTKNRGQFNGKNLKQINFFSNGEQLFEGNSFNTAVNATGQKYKKNQGDQTYYPI
jgi:hypothetical protein